MRYLNALIFLLILTTCQAQENKLLLKQNLISDFSQTPIYSRLTENINGKIEWKEAFKYIDSIDIYSITYLSDGLKVNGLLVKPKKQGNYPCVIYNRGGNRDFGSLVIAHGIMTLGQIAKEGYVVIASQYRGNGGSEGQEEFGGSDVNDITILPEVLKEVEGADIENIGMYGWSRGGMMTYIALTQMNNIKAAAVGGAVSNNFSTIKDRPDMESGVLAELIPNYKTNKEAELEKRSAVKWADKFSKEVPILMLHGNADWRVKPEQSLTLALEFEKYRIPYRLIMFEGGDHGISEHRDEVNEQVINWFDNYLKNHTPLPNMEYHGK
ncbi:prolyl oligopeptidase family serine peptidase [Mangrovimonas sp. AS39]|uniref:alpha/beta hydrolase family protein n=1 Tax=Mangrovimonas futianensis TaxID=2895523 RepID=UPI001E409330|nr:prolyl oligopeptidase family serine peptidase [Mangrovimonas futianensis]MCF1192842.1 prolyl oligopeptidase family serine peptidase [Mangrovimonas futianensis]MCF1196556.1 prolyl oligopeptidase family serine peptidase [Mangrovimonas futianensis]MCF1423038.1 prolyl oligopeptidase family serine peptidase [Mangrovimonas futianensis]